MSEQNLDYAAIRRNVEQGIQRQKAAYRMIFFLTHLIVFMVAMVGAWGTVLAHSQLRELLFNGEPGAGAIILLPTILWAFVILCHMAALYTESDAAEKAMREKLLMREVGEDILRQGLADEGAMEKPKRRAPAKHLRLSGDGELIPVDDDDEVEEREHHAPSNHISN